MILFEWDEAKASSNLRKHGIAFEIAAQVFLDPMALSAQDREVDGEPRWQTLGMIEGVCIILVAHLLRNEDEDEIIRIISARRATRRERERYEQSCTQGGF